MNQSRKKSFCYEYARPAVTVDVVIVTQETPRRVLLIRRKSEPFTGHWAIPGGFVDEHETLEKAARRELLEETGVEAGKLIPLQAFGDPGRDQRGWTISIAYLAEVNPENVKPRADSDAAEVGWHSLHRPPQLAFDHAEILACARRQLRER
jgi:8-oxo-dGTP diphosphatase